MYRNMYTITTNEKRGHEFEGEWEEYMEGFGGRKRKKKNDVIITSKLF